MNKKGREFLEVLSRDDLIDECLKRAKAEIERDKAIALLRELEAHESPSGWPWSQQLWDRVRALLDA
jgi:hypothetical protein